MTTALTTYTRVRITGAACETLAGRVGTISDTVDFEDAGGVLAYYVELDPAPDEDDRPASDMTYPVRADHLEPLPCEDCRGTGQVLLAYGEPYVPSREHGAWMLARKLFPCPECRPADYAAMCAEWGEV